MSCRNAVAHVVDILFGDECCIVASHMLQAVQSRMHAMNVDCHAIHENHLCLDLIFSPSSGKCRIYWPNVGEKCKLYLDFSTPNPFNLVKSFEFVDKSSKTIFGLERDHCLDLRYTKLI